LRALLAAAAVAGALAGTPASALAATAGSDFTRLRFQAASGEANHVVLTWEGATVRVLDSGVRLLLGCVPEGLNAVRCLAPSGDPLAGVGGCSACTALVATGDGDDSVRVVGAPAPGLRMQLAGGAGDDRLSGGTGADAINGDAGSDTASYSDRATPVAVTLDAAANDGAAGEHDDVRTENVSGGAGDDVLSGDDRANELSAGVGGRDLLSGLGGPDTLIGGSGRDVLHGGTGADTLLSFGNRPGVVDELICGAAEDEVQATRADRVAADCEHVYFGGTPMPRLAIGGGERIRARRGVLRLAVSARPAEASPPGTTGEQQKGPAITATASLRALRGTPSGVLARARLAPFAAPGAATLRLRLSRPAARALARRGTIRMRVEISAHDTEGNASITRRIVAVRR
jgi:hypothetical protein